ncbi:SH3 domain-containing protein [Pycnococcus provasolii]
MVAASSSASSSSSSFACQSIALALRRGSGGGGGSTTTTTTTTTSSSDGGTISDHDDPHHHHQQKISSSRRRRSVQFTLAQLQKMPAGTPSSSSLLPRLALLLDHGGVTGVEANEPRASRSVLFPLATARALRPPQAPNAAWVLLRLAIPDVIVGAVRGQEKHVASFDEMNDQQRAQARLASEHRSRVLAECYTGSPKPHHQIAALGQKLLGGTIPTLSRDEREMQRVAHTLLRHVLSMMLSSEIDDNEGSSSSSSSRGGGDDNHNISTESALLILRRVIDATMPPPRLLHSYPPLVLPPTVARLVLRELITATIAQQHKFQSTRLVAARRRLEEATARFIATVPASQSVGVACALPTAATTPNDIDAMIRTVLSNVSKATGGGGGSYEDDAAAVASDAIDNLFCAVASLCQRLLRIFQKKQAFFADETAANRLRRALRSATGVILRDSHEIPSFHRHVALDALVQVLAYVANNASDDGLCAGGGGWAASLLVDLALQDDHIDAALLASTYLLSWDSHAPSSSSRSLFSRRLLATPTIVASGGGSGEEVILKEEDTTGSSLIVRCVEHVAKLCARLHSEHHQHTRRPGTIARSNTLRRHAPAVPPASSSSSPSSSSFSPNDTRRQRRMQQQQASTELAKNRGRRHLQPLRALSFRAASAAAVASAAILASREEGGVRGASAAREMRALAPWIDELRLVAASAALSDASPSSGADLVAIEALILLEPVANTLSDSLTPRRAAELPSYARGGVLQMSAAQILVARLADWPLSFTTSFLRHSVLATTTTTASSSCTTPPIRAAGAKIPSPLQLAESLASDVRHAFFSVSARNDNRDEQQHEPDNDETHAEVVGSTDCTNNDVIDALLSTACACVSALALARTSNAAPSARRPLLSPRDAARTWHFALHHCCGKSSDVPSAALRRRLSVIRGVLRTHEAAQEARALSSPPPSAMEAAELANLERMCAWFLGEYGSFALVCHALMPITFEHTTTRRRSVLQANNNTDVLKRAALGSMQHATLVQVLSTLQRSLSPLSANAVPPSNLVKEALQAVSKLAIRSPEPHRCLAGGILVRWIRSPMTMHVVAQASSIERYAKPPPTAETCHALASNVVDIVSTAYGTLADATEALRVFRSANMMPPPPSFIERLRSSEEDLRSLIRERAPWIGLPDGYPVLFGFSIDTIEMTLTLEMIHDGELLSRESSSPLIAAKQQNQAVVKDDDEGQTQDANYDNKKKTREDDNNNDLTPSSSFGGVVTTRDDDDTDHAATNISPFLAAMRRHVLEIPSSTSFHMPAPPTPRSFRHDDDVQSSLDGDEVASLGDNYNHYDDDDEQQTDGGDLFEQMEKEIDQVELRREDSFEYEIGVSTAEEGDGEDAYDAAAAAAADLVATAVASVLLEKKNDGEEEGDDESDNDEDKREDEAEEVVHKKGDFAQPNLYASAVARFAFDAEAPEELSLCEGDVVTILGGVDDGWVECERGDERGIVPFSYLHMQEPEVEKPHTAVARFAFDAEAPEELSLCEGDVVTTLGGVDDGWIECERGDERGIVPFSYLQMEEVGQG